VLETILSSENLPCTIAEDLQEGLKENEIDLDISFPKRVFTRSISKEPISQSIIDSVARNRRLASEKFQDDLLGYMG